MAKLHFSLLASRPESLALGSWGPSHSALTGSQHLHLPQQMHRFLRCNSGQLLVCNPFASLWQLRPNLVASDRLFCHLLTRENIIMRLGSRGTVPMERTDGTTTTSLQLLGHQTVRSVTLKVKLILQFIAWRAAFFLFQDLHLHRITFSH